MGRMKNLDIQIRAHIENHDYESAITSVHRALNTRTTSKDIVRVLECVANRHKIGLNPTPVRKVVRRLRGDGTLPPPRRRQQWETDHCEQAQELVHTPAQLQLFDLAEH